MQGGKIKSKSGKDYDFEYHDFNEIFGVQSPGVYILVNRIKDMKDFKPEKYFYATVMWGVREEGMVNPHPTESSTGYLYKACKDKKEVDEILNDLDEAGNLVIKDIEP